MSTQYKKRNVVRKDKGIYLRVTEEEFSSINSLCDKAKISKSAYILQSVLNKKVLTNIDAQVIFQIRKIGNNINQMTKIIHIISKFGEDREHNLSDILKELSSMNEQIKLINDFILSTGDANKN